MRRNHLTPKQVVKEDGSVQTYYVNPGGRRNAPTVAVALGMIPVAAMGLAACAPGSDDAGPEPDPSSSSQPVVDPTPAETEAPAPTLKAGDSISAEDAAALNAAWGRVTDDKAYQMPSGEWVVIKGGEPLPEQVAENVFQQLAPPISENYSTGQFNAASREAMNAAVAAQEAATGRKAAVVIHGMQATSSGGEEAVWAVGGSTKGYNGQSKEEAIAVAQAWVDQSPSGRMIIVVDAIG